MMYGFERFAGNGCGEYMGGIGRGAGFGHFGFMGLIGLLIIAAIVVVIIFVVKNKKSIDSDIIEELKVLYARGEITEEEYLKRKSVIKKK